MNKYQEAFESIKRVVVFNKNYSDYINDLKVIKELVNKATPMKPVYRIPDISWNKNEKLPHCPTCDWLLGWERGCHNNKCRQKIDWSGINEY